MVVAGYAHPAYAASLAEVGEPRHLPTSGAWVLERRIEGSPHRDAMGCYPLFTCVDWTRLGDDLAAIGSDLVALSAVTDPLSQPDADILAPVFPHLLKPFKCHYVVDLDDWTASRLDAHHRRNVRQALDNLSIELVENPAACADEWVALYQMLIEKHHIGGVAAFSEGSLRQQLAVPGAVAFKATRDGATVGMTIWYVQGEVGYYHLAAYTDSGYTFRASYGLFSRALDDFKQRGLRSVSLGGAAGLVDDPTNGLARFKRGWATGTRTVFLCGRIFNADAYNALASRRPQAGVEYFPSYRAGEFN